MRVLQVFNQYLNPGGEEIWVDSIPELAGERIKVEELRFRSSEWTGDDAPSKLRQARLIGDNPGSRERLREAVGRFRPDILLYHNLIPVASLGLYDEARRLRVPVVQYLHNFRPFSPSGTLWTNGRIDGAAMRGNPWPEIRVGAWNGSRVKTAVIAWHLARLRRSGALDAVRIWIAVSDFMREKFIGAGLPAEQVATLRHCWVPSPQTPEAEEGDFYLFLGRLYENKGVRTLLDAWGLLEDRIGPRCPRLVIAGKGPMEEDVQAAAERSDHIEFASFVDGEEKQGLLAGCRALLAPSIWWEPLGLIVHEAYDHRRPVIASGSGGLAETVRDGETGLLHKPGDPASLAGAVERMEGLAEDERARMGMAGRKWLVGEASPGQWREAFQGILENAL